LFSLRFKVMFLCYSDFILVIFSIFMFWFILLMWCSDLIICHKLKCFLNSKRISVLMIHESKIMSIWSCWVRFLFYQSFQNFDQWRCILSFSKIFCFPLDSIISLKFEAFFCLKEFWSKFWEAFILGDHIT
jgi:hypothetical protein